ncbi:hypothetical protein Leryth_020724 [Lithospermum erythrorhizon]|nr:hypothetical protein Leryth_020724 [Lithospermum erythrorhizon]
MVHTTCINPHNLSNKPSSSSSSSTIKFLCSYGGKILPRYPDGNLRYHGGHTRLLAVDRSVSFAELLVKLREMICGASLSLRCQLPTEDLDALVSITSDEDLANLIEEYDRVAASKDSSIKIRAFIFAPKSAQKTIPATSSTTTTVSSSSSNESVSSSNSNSSLTKMGRKSSRCPRIPTSPRTSSFCYTSRPGGGVPPYNYEKAVGKLPQYACYGYGNTRNSVYLIHNGNHWL